MRDMLRISLVLMLIAAVSGGALAYAHAVTAPAIAKALEQAKQEALAQALPGAQQFQDQTKDYAAALGDPKYKCVKEVWAALSGSDRVGTVVVVAPTGYGGPVTCLIGVGGDGKVTGVQILAAPSETPGLGSRVKEPAFREQFRGQSSPPLKVQAITGATISSRAVIGGVEAALDLLRAGGGK